MKSIKGTQTEQNLLTSFAGESQARNRYTFFASQAKKDGYVLVSAVFSEIAEQEKEHAKRMFKYLEGGSLAITATYPAGAMGSTVDNLQAAAAGDTEEWSGGISRNCSHVPHDRRGGKVSRGTIPPPLRPNRRRHHVPQWNAHRLALPQLRIRLRGPRSPRIMPRMRTPARLFRTPQRNFLNH